MPEIDLLKLKKDLERDEGRVKLAYEDSVGKVSVAIGRNLDDVGLSDDEIDYLYANDERRVLAELDRAFPWWREQPEPVQRFMANLNFNLGLAGFRKWKETLRFIEAKQYKAAARQFRSNKRYFSQVGQRAERLAKLLESVVK
jgi:lysozyme